MQPKIEVTSANKLCSTAKQLGLNLGRRPHTSIAPREMGFYQNWKEFKKREHTHHAASLLGPSAQSLKQLFHDIQHSPAHVRH